MMMTSMSFALALAMSTSAPAWAPQGELEGSSFARALDEAAPTRPMHQVEGELAHPSDASKEGVGPTSPWRRRATTFAVGATMSLVAVPLSLYAGELWGGAINDVYAAAIPAAVFYLLFQPLVTTVASGWVSDELEPGSARLWPSALVGLGAHVAITAAALVAGAWVGRPRDVAALTAVEAVLVPALLTWSYEW